MSGISNITVQQTQALRSGYHIESKAEKDNSATIPMYEDADKAVESFLHGQSVSLKQAANELTAENSFDSAEKENFAEIESLVEKTMSKRLFDENEGSVGSALESLAKSIKQTLDQNPLKSGQTTNKHPKVKLRGGFSIDLASGTISFDISSFSTKTENEDSPDEFLNALNENKTNSFPTFRDIQANAAEVPTELRLQKDIDAEKKKSNTAKEVIIKSSKLPKTYQNSSLINP